MGVYRETGNYMLMYGILSIVMSVIYVILLFVFLGAIVLSDFLSMLRTIFSIELIVGIVGLILFVPVAIYSIRLADGLDTSTMKVGAYLLMAAIVLTVVILAWVYFEILRLISLAFQGLLTPEELFSALLRISAIEFIGSIFSIISNIVYGMGIRQVGDILGLGDLKTAGLLIILGFIPFLLPIGFIIGGLALRKLE